MGGVSPSPPLFSSLSTSNVGAARDEEDESRLGGALIGVNDVVRLEPEDTGEALGRPNAVSRDDGGDGVEGLRRKAIGMTVEEEAEVIVGVEMLIGVEDVEDSETAVGLKGIAL